MKIGETIAMLRKNRKMTQEQLANAVGISSQAVSKWEKGGTPDIELLPNIAKVLNVTVDELFGISVHPTRNAEELAKEMERFLINTPITERIKVLSEWAWRLQLALFSNTEGTNTLYAPIEDATRRANNNILTEDLLKRVDFNKETPTHSYFITDEGMSLVRANRDRRFFLLLPKPSGGWRFDNADLYVHLYKDFSDIDFWRVVFYLHKNPDILFSSADIVKMFDVTDDKARWIVDRLLEYWLAREKNRLMGDAGKQLYEFTANEAFIPFLLFTEEMTQRAFHFIGLAGDGTFDKLLDNDNP